MGLNVHRKPWIFHGFSSIFHHFRPEGPPNGTENASAVGQAMWRIVVLLPCLAHGDESCAVKDRSLLQKHAAATKAEALSARPFRVVGAAAKRSSESM